MLTACICRANKTIKSLIFQSRIRWLGITVWHSPTRVLHRADLFTFYLRSRGTRSLPGILSRGLTSFYLQDKGSWSGSYCTMIHPAPNIHEAAEDTRQLRPLCQINKLGNLKATGCFIAIFGPIFLKPSGWVFFFFFPRVAVVVLFLAFSNAAQFGKKRAARAEILWLKGTLLAAEIQALKCFDEVETIESNSLKHSAK